MPEQLIPSWKNIKMFALGGAWAVIGGLGPAVIFIWDSYQRYTDPVDWTQAIHLALIGGGTAAIGYWRKHKALLQVPPPDETHLDDKQ